MSEKKKILNKNSTKIIVAIIGAIALIVPSCINYDAESDSNNNKLKNNSENNSNKELNDESLLDYIPTDNSNDSLDKKLHDKKNILEDNPENQDKQLENQENNFENSGDNSGFMVNDTHGNVVVYNYPNQKDNEEKMTLTGEISKIVTYGENNEIVDTYYDDTSIPICNLQMSNGNIDAINIKNIFVEVVNCNVFNETIDKNIPPDSWATMEKKIFWSCNISPEYKRYQSILLGYNENSTNDLSNTNYVNIAGHDTGQFELEIHPNTPGEYVINVIVEYIINGKVMEEILPNVGFTYNPDTEYAIEPTLDVIEDIEFFE